MINPLVTTEWLADHMRDTTVRIVDCRWRGEFDADRLYREGHIEGAFHLDWHKDLSRNEGDVDDLLLGAEDFSKVMGSVSISNESLVVAYAETDYSGAARLWWALNYYGHENVRVLDGGITKWKQEGRPVVSGQNAPNQRPAATFAAKRNRGLLATKDDVLAIVSVSGDHLPAFLDTRPEEQHHGWAVWTPLGSRNVSEDGEILVGEKMMRGGRLPRAVNIPVTDFYDPESWTMLNPDQIRERTASLGLDPSNKVICYCGVGISGSGGLLALRRAGFAEVALYDASWSEWGIDTDLPIERDPLPDSGESGAVGMNR